MTLRALLLLLLLPALASAGPSAGAPVGLVLSAAGGASVSLGSMLVEGQRIELPAGASVVVSLITTCEELSLAGPGAVAVQGGAAVLEGATLVKTGPSPGCVKADRVALSAASQVRSGAVVVRGKSDGRLSPRGGFVSGHERTVRWDGPLADGRAVVVMVSRGADVLLEEDATGGSFELPASLPLVPGVEYGWSVEPAGVKPGPHLEGTFRLAEDAIATQLATLQGRASDASGWLRVAFFCEVHLLEDAAARAYARALALDGAAEGAKQRLLELDLPG
jgi:hypothetical protein